MKSGFRALLPKARDKREPLLLRRSFPCGLPQASSLALVLLPFEEVDEEKSAERLVVEDCRRHRSAMDVLLPLLLLLAPPPLVCEAVERAGEDWGMGEDDPELPPGAAADLGRTALVRDAEEANNCDKGFLWLVGSGTSSSS